MPPIWVGFWAQNFLNKGPFFGRFSINMGWFSRNWQNLQKCHVPPPPGIRTHTELSHTISIPVKSFMLSRCPLIVPSKPLIDDFTRGNSLIFFRTPSLKSQKNHIQNHKITKSQEKSHTESTKNHKSLKNY